MTLSLTLSGFSVGARDTDSIRPNQIYNVKGKGDVIYEKETVCDGAVSAHGGRDGCACVCGNISSYSAVFFQHRLITTVLILRKR